MKKILLLLTVLFPVLGNGQNFSLDSHVIAAGGGTSSGGNFALAGTVGQPDAGKLSGGNFSLEGGFLAGVVLVQTAGAPKLSIQLNGVNAVISWPVEGSTDFILEESLNLNSPASWGVSGAAVGINGNVKNATVLSSGVKFYRLRKP